jgi:hypothetical protein
MLNKIKNAVLCLGFAGNAFASFSNTAQSTDEDLIYQNTQDSAIEIMYLEVQVLSPTEQNGWNGDGWFFQADVGPRFSNLAPQDGAFYQYQICGNTRNPSTKFGSLLCTVLL